MKPLIRLFFRTLRLVLGPILLLKERLTRPTGLQRGSEQRAAVDRQCQDLTLYQFKTCPFCIKVRQEMRRLSLNIERRDAQHEGPNRSELLKGSGGHKVPCLKITEANGQVKWLNESGAIIEYLRGRFAA